MGQIRKRGDIWWIRYYRNGRRYEESARTDKWEKARDLLRDREGDVAKGVPISPRIGRVTFEDAVKDILNDYSVNGKSSRQSEDDRHRGRTRAVVPRAAHGFDHDCGHPCVCGRPAREWLRQRDHQSRTRRAQ